MQEHSTASITVRVQKVMSGWVFRLRFFIRAPIPKPVIGCSDCLIWYSIPNVNRFLHFLFPLPTCISALSFKRLQGMNNKAMSGASLTSIRAAIIQAPKLFHKVKSLIVFLDLATFLSSLNLVNNGSHQWFISFFVLTLSSLSLMMLQLPLKFPSFSYFVHLSCLYLVMYPEFHLQIIYTLRD